MKSTDLKVGNKVRFIKEYTMVGSCNRTLNKIYHITSIDGYRIYISNDRGNSSGIKLTIFYKHYCVLKVVNYLPEWF